MTDSPHRPDATHVSDNEPPPQAPRSLEHYASLLREARTLRGTSLTRDAWHRLQRNRIAMLSLMVLVAMTLLAALTPLLPLQSPQQQHLGFGENNRQFQEPQWSATQLLLEEGEDPLTLSTALQNFEAKRSALQDQFERSVGQDRERLRSELDNLDFSHPFRRMWHNPSWFDSQLIRLRMTLFGDWCWPSICGTDQLGRDILTRLFWGARVSLSVGAVAALVSLVIGVLYGAISGYLGGVTDMVMMRIVDILYSIPFIFVVIFAITVLGQEEIRQRLQSVGVERIVIFYVLIGAIYWLTMARVVRGQVLSLKNEPFIEAARVIGASRRRIILLHLLPNVMSIVIVYLTLTIPSIILFEAFLSFLGLGVEPPNVSWGLLANDGIQAITPIRIYWWLVLFPGMALGMTLVALNFLGDGLRDALDPRLKST